MKIHSITFERDDLELLAEYFYDHFLPQFTHQPEGDINPNTKFVISKKMKNKVGLAVLFENKIRLSLNYFANNPQLLPYTIFHEMTHLWLYHCGFDPGHTKRFYKKMLEFEQTGYTIDPEVHVHTRLAAEGTYVYICHNCENRWHLREALDHEIYCALCFKKEGIEHFATLDLDYHRRLVTLTTSSILNTNFDEIDKCA